MKAILMSIQSKWLCEILNGRKTDELRKRFPKEFRGWVYCYITQAKPYLADFGDNEYPYKSGGYECSFDLSNIEKHDAKVLNGKVVCRFWVDNVEEIDTNLGHPSIYVKACVQDQEAIEYAKGKTVKVISISQLEIFDKPKELGEFSVERYAEMPNGVFPCYEPLTKAPQSWQYVEVEE